MRRDKSISIAHANFDLNRAITVSKCNFLVHHVALAFHEATVLKKLLKHSTMVLLA